LSESRLFKIIYYLLDKVQAALPENEWLYGFVMSFGDKVTVIRPDYFKENIIKRYENALQHYRKEQ